MRRPDREREFTEFVAARQAHLRRIAYSLCGDWHRADDLVQTALIKLYVAWPRVQRNGGEEAYVRTIIVRSNIDESRRPWRRELSGLDGVRESASRSELAIEERDSLVEALQLLPEMQRKAVVLRHWLGLSVEETAAELGLSQGTVKSHTSRGLTRLRELLDVESIEGTVR